MFLYLRPVIYVSDLPHVELLNEPAHVIVIHAAGVLQNPIHLCGIKVIHKAVLDEVIRVYLLPDSNKLALVVWVPPQRHDREGRIVLAIHDFFPIHLRRPDHLFICPLRVQDHPSRRFCVPVAPDVICVSVLFIERCPQRLRPVYLPESDTRPEGPVFLVQQRNELGHLKNLHVVKVPEAESDASNQCILSEFLQLCVEIIPQLIAVPVLPGHAVAKKELVLLSCEVVEESSRGLVVRAPPVRYLFAGHGGQRLLILHYRNIPPAVIFLRDGGNLKKVSVLVVFDGRPDKVPQRLLVLAHLNQVLICTHLSPFTSTRICMSSSAPQSA